MIIKNPTGCSYRSQANSHFLFYGNGDEAWKRAIGSELKKAGAYRAVPLPATYI
jgi:hypothetical protein